MNAPVTLVDIGGDQVGRLGVGARDEDGGHAANVGREPCGDELVDGLLRRHEDLAAHVPAFLGRGQLILEVHAGGTGLDHLLHQLERVEHPAEARLGVRDDRLEPVDG